MMEFAYVLRVAAVCVEAYTGNVFIHAVKT